MFRGSVSATGPNAQPLIGDAVTNQIWEMSLDQRTDGEDPVVFEFSGLLEVTGPPARCDNVVVEATVGQAADPLDDPVVQLAVSDDLGSTFSDEMARPLGRQGARQTRVAWRRLGVLRPSNRIFRWRTTEPMMVRKAKYNEPVR